MVVLKEREKKARKLTRVTHFSHPHVLSLLSKVYDDGGWYECDLCGEDGYSWVYHCNECTYDLHPMCAMIMTDEEFQAEKDQKIPALDRLEGILNSTENSECQKKKLNTLWHWLVNNNVEKIINMVEDSTLKNFVLTFHSQIHSSHDVLPYLVEFAAMINSCDESVNLHERIPIFFEKIYDSLALVRFSWIMKLCKNVTLNNLFNLIVTDTRKKKDNLISLRKIMEWNPYDDLQKFDSETPIIISEKDKTEETKFFCLWHYHALVYLPEFNSQYMCSYCNLQGFGSVYCCLKCGVYSHMSCARSLENQILTEQHEHSLHVVDLEADNKPCNYCNLAIRGIAYTCKDCDFYLHSICSVPTDQVPNLRRSQRGSQCDFCKKPILTSSVFFNEISCHMYCAKIFIYQLMRKLEQLYCQLITIPQVTGKMAAEYMMAGTNNSGVLDQFLSLGPDSCLFLCLDLQALAKPTYHLLVLNFVDMLDVAMKQLPSDLITGFQGTDAKEGITKQLERVLANHFLASTSGCTSGASLTLSSGLIDRLLVVSHYLQETKVEQSKVTNDFMLFYQDICHNSKAKLKGMYL
eukprot:TRINITY_DN5739_c0_g1_i17.p1 TRINITY_DN5739_c0_g1~~TRINITY_DN5739_c0_g1_i17.p1  ORF type:complete len:578 (-),score=135.30 TRINITY_DN5739_c0_g1_i17:137-1870(-)